MPRKGGLNRAGKHGKSRKLKRRSVPVTPEVLLEAKCSEQKHLQCPLATPDASSTTESSHVEWATSHQDHSCSQMASPSSMWNNTSGGQIAGQEMEQNCGWKRSSLAFDLIDRQAKRARSGFDCQTSPSKRQKYSIGGGGKRKQGKNVVSTSANGVLRLSARCIPKEGVSGMGSKVLSLDPGPRSYEENQLGPGETGNSDDLGHVEGKGASCEAYGTMKISLQGSKEKKVTGERNSPETIVTGGEVGNSNEAKVSDDLIHEKERSTENDEEMLLEHKGFCRREQCFIDLEERGELRSEYVRNDGQKQHMIWLMGVKMAIMNQLPNMPREYITRVVMDRRHRSVALIQNKSGSCKDFIMGAAVYRPFHKLKFGELAFFAIDGVQQVKGFGTHLMNCLKQYARDNDGLAQLLTFADNKAIGFFSKNGFSRHITLPKEHYAGYIKEYEFAVPMECVLLQQIQYQQIPKMIKDQRRLLLSKTRQYSKSHVRRPGLDIFKDADYKPIPITALPGVSEANGFTNRNSLGSLKLIMDNKVVDANSERLTEFMELVIREVKKRGEAWPFLAPVNATDVPDYYTIITDPVDIGLIEHRLSTKKYYITLDIFQADWQRMFDNCRFYNAESTVYYKLAEKLDRFVSRFVNTRVVRGL